MATLAPSTLQSHYTSFRLSRGKRRSRETYRALRRKASVSVLHSISFRARKKQPPYPALPRCKCNKQAKRNLISPTGMPAETAKCNLPNNHTEHTSTLSPSPTGMTPATNFSKVTEILVTWQTFISFTGRVSLENMHICFIVKRYETRRSKHSCVQLFTLEGVSLEDQLESDSLKVARSTYYICKNNYL